MIFFWLSKALNFLVNPLIWILTCLLLAIFFKNPKKKKRFLIFALLLFLVFSNSFLSDEAIRLWELREKQWDTEAVYDVAIVLGGGMITYDAQTNDMTFRHNTDRIMQAMNLYYRGHTKKILISSGAGSLVYRNMLEACLLKDFFTGIGIPENDIWAECESDNTRQNALYSAQILNDSIHNGKFLLITSGFHMRRAIGCFKKVNIDVDIYPTNLITGERRYDIGHLLVPNIDALLLWKKLLHEIFGCITYKILGYI